MIAAVISAAIVITYSRYRCPSAVWSCDHSWLSSLPDSGYGWFYHGRIYCSLTFTEEFHRSDHLQVGVVLSSHGIGMYEMKRVL